MARLDLTTSTPDPLSGLVQELRCGRDVLVTGPSEAARALLDGAAEALAGEGRVVRVAAGPGALSLSGLMAQIAGDSDLAAQDDAVLGLGYRRLAVPEAPGQRVVLLIGDAGLLQRPALRFVQHIARNAPALSLVLAGGPELDRLLDEPDFAALRMRLPKGAELPPTRERVSTISKRKSGAPVWAGAGLGLAASVALAAWALRAPTPTVAVPLPVVAEQAEAPSPAPQPAKTLAVKAEPVKAEPAKAEPARPPPPVQQAMAPPPPPPPGPQAAEPERLPTAPRPRRQVDARPKEPPVHAASRRSHVARAAPRGPEPANSGRDWDEEDAARAAYGSQPPPDWDRASDEPWGAPPREGPYIGTFTADRYGIRTFRYEGGWR